MDNSDALDFLVQHSKDCIFNHPVFLDKLSSGEYNISTCKDGSGKIIAALPYAKVKGKGISRISMPAFAQFFKVVFDYPKGLSKARKFTFEKNCLVELLKGIPQADHILFHIHPEQSNLLPFIWEGYSTAVRYTFMLDTNCTLDELNSNLRPKSRRYIRNAEKSMRIEEDNTIDLLHDIRESDFKEKGIANPYSKQELQALFDTGKELTQGVLLKAIDNVSNKPIGAAFFLWDDKYFHYLVSGAYPGTKSTGATPYLIWKGIELAHQKGLTFNFEGSMIESIARHFSSYGSTPIPYYSVEKYNNKLVKGIKLALGRA
ncbi:MAG: hypothetical protein CL843_12465 [Crocinitomicaceae bacterium]|nr:hypothetical protein [Crocinitomicaceae bacterium]